MSLRWSLALAASLVACAPTLPAAYLRAFAAGERAYGAGRYDEAAAAFADAAKQADRVKDRDESLFLEARALERASRFDDQRAVLAELVRVSPGGPRGARARYDLAYLEIQHGDAEKGWALLEAAILAAPSHGVADRSFQRLTEHRAQRDGAPATVAWMQSIAPRLKATDLDQVVTYGLGEQLEAAGRPDEARTAYVRAATDYPYPFGGLTDDAWWRAAEIDRARGRPREALGDLQAMLAPREPSMGNGSYERPRFSAAQLRIAEIYRDDLHDHESARRELRRLFTDFKTSILRDDALWQEAKLALSDGDHEDACEAARLLARELPDSRYAACASLVCPGLEGAPKRACADYIARELSPAAP